MAPHNARRVPCVVEFYSGHKGLETPRSVRFGGKQLNITRILSHQREADAETGAIRDLFTCQTPQGVLVITLHASGSTDASFKNGTNRKT